MRVAVYAISRNEADNVPGFLETCRGADVVLVADTGSTDATVAALRDGGAAVVPAAIRPWRFDTARNVALALVPGDVDVCVALDLDERLSPGWRAAMEAQWTPATTRGHYLYAWSHRPDGSPGVQFWSDKIHARHGYVWRHPCHEALYPDRLEERHVHFRGLAVDHWPDPAKSRSQYLPLLKVAVGEDPHSSRNAFYLGRELAMHRDWAAAERELRRYLALPGATWAEQNATAMGLLAQCRAGLGDRDGATAWLRRATATAPSRRDGWVQLADALYEAGDWAGCHAAVSAALAIDAGPGASANDPRAGGAHPHDLASFAAWQLGRHEEAVAHALEAHRLSPGDERLALNAARLRGLVPQGAGGRPGPAGA